MVHYTQEEIALHNTEKDCWMILGEKGNEKVYDVTTFLDDHPGGPEILLDLAGQNGNEEFEDIGHSKDAREMLKQYEIGQVNMKVKKEVTTAKEVVHTSPLVTTSSTWRLMFPIVVLMVAYLYYQMYHGDQ